MINERDPIADLESALEALRSVLTGPFADPDRAKAEELARESASDDEALAALEAKNSESQQRLDAANDRAASQREAERLDQALKSAFHVIGQLRASLDDFIVVIAPLGAAGAAAAAAAESFRETIRDSAAEALHHGAQRKRKILESDGAPLQPAAGAEQAEEQSVSAYEMSGRFSQ